MSRLGGRILLDIRTSAEYCAGHVCGAINVPTPLPPMTRGRVQALRQALRDLTSGMDPGVALAVYCKKGIRARRAREILMDMGFTNVVTLGGIQTEPLKSYLAAHCCQCC